MDTIFDTVLKRITKDPTGIDAKLDAFFYEDAQHNVYFDEWGHNGVKCDECARQQKVVEEGYFYCPNRCFEEVQN